MSQDPRLPRWVAVTRAAGSAVALYAAIQVNDGSASPMAAAAYVFTFLSLAFGAVSLLRNHQGIGWTSLVLAVGAVYATGMYRTARDLSDMQ